MTNDLACELGAEAGYHASIEALAAILGMLEYGVAVEHSPPLSAS